MRLGHALRRLSLPYLRRNEVLTLLTMTGIGLGVTIYVAVEVAAASLRTSLVRTIDGIAGRAQLQITERGGGCPEDALEHVRALPIVATAAPVIEEVVRTRATNRGSALVLGIDLLEDYRLRDRGPQDILGDTLALAARPDAIGLSRQHAARIGATLGSQITIETATGSRRFTVQALVDPTDLAAVFGGDLAIMDVYSAQIAFNRGQRFDRIDVVLREHGNLDAARLSIATTLGRAYDVTAPAERGARMDSLIRSFSNAVALASWQAMFIGGYLVFNIFALASVRRRHEVAVLRVLGMRRQLARSMFLSEGALLGLTGSTLGALFGLLLAGSAHPLLLAAAQRVYGALHVPESISWTAAPLLLGVGLGTGCAIVAAWLPARRAAYVDPIEALTSTPTRRARTVGRMTRRGWGLAALSGSLLLRSLAEGNSDPRLVFLAVAALGLAVILLTPDLTVWASKLIGPALRWAGGVEGRLAATALLRSPERTSATVAAVMLSVGFGVALAGYARGLHRSLGTWMAQTFHADLFVAGTPRPAMKRSVQLPEELGEQLEALPGVGQVERMRRLQLEDEAGMLTIVGLEFGKFLRRSGLTFVAGDSESTRARLISGECVVASSNLARRRGITPGDEIRLGRMADGATLPVCGVVVDYRSDMGTVLVDLAAFRRHWGDHAVDVFSIVLAPTAHAATVRERILDHASDREHQLFVMSGREYRRAITRMVDGLLVISYLPFMVSLCVAIIGIVNYLLMSVTTRRHEIGVLKALGARRAGIRRLIVLEAIATASIGSLLGFALGAYLLDIAVHVVGASLTGWVFPYSYPVWVCVVILPALLAAAVVSAWYPARVAIGTSVTAALADE